MIKQYLKLSINMMVYKPIREIYIYIYIELKTYITDMNIIMEVNYF